MARKKKETEPSIGHNSNLSAAQKTAMQGYIAEVEHFEAEKRKIGEDLSEIYKDAKEHGFDTKAMRHLVKIRRMEAMARESFEHSVDAYKMALGMLDGTPLGDAAMGREFTNPGTSPAPFHAPPDDEPKQAETEPTSA